MDRSLELISDYAASLSYADLPPSTVHNVKLRIIDTLGCALGAVDAGPSRIAQKVCYGTDAPLTARVIGTLQRTSPESAAFANATMARYLDFNDSLRVKDAGHPSDAISACLAVAEATHASGKDLITAVTLAYEMQVRFIEEIAWDSKGWDQGIYIVLGAALAAGKLMGLNKEQLGNAAAIALIANVPMYQTRIGELPMWKAAAAGNACRQGIFSAILAKEGMTGPEEAIEGELGLKKVLSGPFEIAPLGGKDRQFAVERVTFKSYPVRDSCQLVIKTALALREQVKPQDVESLYVEMYASAIRTSVKSRQLWAPKTRETADHSSPFSNAAALVDGDVTPETFSQKRFLAPEVLDMIGRMEIVDNPEFTKQTPGIRNIRMTAKTRSGESKMVHQVFSLEDIQKWVSDEDLLAKYRKLAAHSIAADKAEATLQILQNLENLDDCAKIVDNLKAS